jgi:hypothetical protein
MEHTLSAIRRRSIDALDEAICRLSARMDAACYEQLVLIREFDERAGWLESLFTNCSEWLAWRCDISLSAAREKVRVAHALLQLPNISQAFAEGRLSYTKVRALTRVTHLRNEGELLRFALKHSAMQVEERCREFRCGTVDSTDAANRVHERRYLSLHRHPGRGLPIESVRRIACDAETVTIVEDENEQPLSVGRRTRTIPPRISQALWARDKGCTFPGCHRRRFVDGHHVKHWAAGGETSLDNLLLLCTRHHRAVHEGGFTIRKDFQDHWRFFRPDGIAVPACGYIAHDAQAENVDCRSRR